MKNTLISTVFWALIGVFLLILGTFFVPAVGDLFRGPQFLLLLLILFLLGGTLILVTARRRVEKKQKKFLILTGASAVGFVVGSVLHNLFYAVEILTENIAALSLLAGVLHGLFFFIAVLICPLTFLVGALGSLILFIKKK